MSCFFGSYGNNYNGNNSNYDDYGYDDANYNDYDSNYNESNYNDYDRNYYNSNYNDCDCNDDGVAGDCEEEIRRAYWAGYRDGCRARRCRRRNDFDDCR